NLDEKNELAVMEIFQRLHKDGHTIIMVTHDPHIGMLADQRIELEHGRIVPVHTHDLVGTLSEPVAQG
ncbi:MAG: hypothetical protein HYV46_11260, partial [candidate division NC10 bacterium]|nr:hypothetical protein [candidate division NC10 bacterium]